MRDQRENRSSETPASDPTEVSGAGRVWRWTELILLFFGVPALVAVVMDPQQRFRPAFEAIGLDGIYVVWKAVGQGLIPLLLLFTAVITVVLVRDPTFENKRLWNRRAFTADFPRVALLFLICGPLMLLIAWALATHTDVMTAVLPNGESGSVFLWFPREAPLILGLIAIGYPWVSAYPQEILHRAFFFHRYEPLVRSKWVLFGLNVLAFAWLHVPFWSIEAILLTLPGGVLFASTYLKTKSTLAAGMEHALYGWWAFFTGPGWFVLTGSVGT